MVKLGIVFKVATLPVVALGVGIGVDYVPLSCGASNWPSARRTDAVQAYRRAIAS